MTVCLETTIQRWNGLSTDEKPSPSDVKEGSTYHAIDTGEEFIFHNGMWEQDLREIRAINWGFTTPDIEDMAGDGRKIIITAGMPERLSASSIQIDFVIIQAELDNAGTVVVGSSTVIAALATRRGVALLGGDSITFAVSDLFLIWLDVTSSGDGVTYFWTKK